MREYGKIATRVWTDARVLQLDAPGKLVWVYLLAGSQSNCVGCFRCTGHHLAADAICPAEGGEAALARLAELGLIERDPAAGLVWLPRWLRYNPLVNPNMGKGALMELLALPASPLLARVVESLRPFARLLPSDWEGQVAHLFPNPLGNGLGNGLANMSPIPIPSHPNPTHEEDGSPSGSPRAPEAKGRKAPAGKPDVPADSLRLAELLADLMRGNNPKARVPASLTGWAQEIDRCHRIDKYTWQEIEVALRWAQADDFWRANVLSGATLRKQMDKLTLAQRRGPGKPAPAPRPAKPLPALHEAVRNA